jgi:hypothetical protein
LSIMDKKYPVIPSDTERVELKSLIAAGTAPARKLTHARILRKADQGSEGPAIDECQTLRAYKGGRFLAGAA